MHIYVYIYSGHFVWYFKYVLVFTYHSISRDVKDSLKRTQKSHIGLQITLRLLRRPADVTIQYYCVQYIRFVAIGELDNTY